MPSCAERFAALEPGDRKWLERLAVGGGRISPDFLVRAFPPTTRAEIDEAGKNWDPEPGNPRLAQRACEGRGGDAEVPLQKHGHLGVARGHLGRRVDVEQAVSRRARREVTHQLDEHRLHRVEIGFCVAQRVEAGGLLLQVQLEGYSDRRGDVAYNLALSQRRIDSIRRILEAQGIAADRIREHAWGEARAAAQDGDADAMIFDRAVIISIGDSRSNRA